MPRLTVHHLRDHMLSQSNARCFDSSTELLCSIAASVAVYDFIFYWVHLALHKSPWLLRNVHATHHRQDQLISREVVHHSFVDGAMQVGANVFALKLLGLHPLARAAHNVVVTYLLTESHAGYDMPWMVHNIVPCGILGGPPCHEAHHKYGTVNFHQVSGFPYDRLSSSGLGSVRGVQLAGLSVYSSSPTWTTGLDTMYEGA